MAVFDDLPAELVHRVTIYLTPTCCEDSKLNILAFRSVQRRTWRIANQYAFKYMTLYSHSPKDESRLGSLARLAQPDSNGSNIRDLVREVGVVMPLLELSLVHRDADPPVSFYHERVRVQFAKLLGKKEEYWAAEKEIASLNY